MKDESQVSDLGQTSTGYSVDKVLVAHKGKSFTDAVASGRNG